MSENILRDTELTGVIGRSEMDKLSSVVGEDKWNAYRAEYDNAAALGPVSKYPIQLDIELNASCNLKCPMCPISAESAKGKGKETWFSHDKYKKIITDGVKKGLKAVKLNYINEPLIRKDVIKFIEFARDAGVVDIYMSTNAVLLTDKVAKDIINSGLSRIQISIDAVSAGIYDQMRPGGDFNKVLKNVNNLIRLKETLKSVTPLIRINFVRTDINEHELDSFVAYWERKVDMIGIQEFIKPPVSSKDVGSETTSNKKIEGFHCSFPFKQLVINNELDVLPCCTFWGEYMPVGSIRDNSLSEIWNGNKMKELRALHKKGEYWKNEICKKCVEGGSV